MATIADIIAAAFGALGTPYSWGGGGSGGASYGIGKGSSTKGFDCSGLMQYVFAQAGIKIPRTTYTQIHAGQAVGLNSLKAGDLVFTEADGSGGYGHVGLYIGNGQVIESPHTGANVRVESLSDFGPLAARRVTGGLQTGDIASAEKTMPGGYTSAGSLPNSGWSKGDFESALASAGFTAGLINSDKTLKKLFQQAVTGQWSADRFTGELMKTKWWTSRTESQRKYDELAKSDPKEFQSQINAKIADLQNLAGTEGVTISSARLKAMAQSVLRNGLNTNETQKLITAEFKYNPKALYTGQVGKMLSDYQTMASNYFVTPSSSVMGSWLSKSLNGQMDSNGVQSYLTSMAKQKYSWFADKLDAGQTMADIADPYKQQYAQLLETPAENIKNSDPLLQKALDYRDPTSGNRGAMTSWQFADTLRNDPRWLQTDNAKSAAMSTADSLLKSFGLVAG